MSTIQRDDDADYESDPEEAQRSLVMRRRRAASDEEEDSAVEDGGRRVEGGGESEDVKRVVRVRSDESEGEGGAAVYDDDDDEEYYSEGEEVFDGVVIFDEVVRGNRVLDEEGSEHVEESVREEAGGVSAAKDGAGEWGKDEGEEEEAEENLDGKKENEPFAVPTAGAFYMHDDRFGDILGGRNR